MFTILETLRTTSGTNDKIAILTANEGNNELKTYLQLALDNKITFGIATLPQVLGQGVAVKPFKQMWEDFLSLTQRLANRELTGNAAITAILSFFAGTDSKEYGWYRKCIEKDLACIGIGRSTVEKVWPNLCGKFKCNLAEEESELPKFDWSKGASVELKLNGVRTLVGVLAGEIVWIKGRSGLEIDKFYPVIESLSGVLAGDWVLDGEVHCENSLENTMTVFGTMVDKTREDFKTDASYQKWVKEKQKVALDLRDKCTYDVFDILPMDEFNAQECSKGYLGRRLQLEEVSNRLLAAGITKIRVIESIPVEVENIKFLQKKGVLTIDEQKQKDAIIKAAMEEAISIANQFMWLGLEGGILKANHAKYQYKRARNFIKIKENTGEFEAEIVGYEIAKDIYTTTGELDKPQLGNFTLKYRNDIGEFSQSGCGTGKLLTKVFKEEVAEDPESFIGKIVTLSGQRFSEDHIILVPAIDRMRPDRTSLEE